jgi:hypothetical protein
MKLREKLTYANVMATVAVFFALAGGAWAVSKAPKNSVVTKSIKNNAVKESKIASNAVTTGKVKDGAISAAKIGGGAAVKNTVVREFVIPNQATNAFDTKDIQCASGEQAIGGGVTGTIVGTRNFPNLDIDTEIRTNGPIDANGSAATDGSTPTGWHLSAHVISGPRDLHFYAVCAQR